MFLDKQDEVVYYDPCESPEELKVIDAVMGLQEEKNLELKELSRQCQRLESRRGRICARRAHLRSRKAGAPSSFLFFLFPGISSFMKDREVLKISLLPELNFLCLCRYQWLQLKYILNNLLSKDSFSFWI